MKVRTLKRSTNRWGPTTVVGEAADNHGGPALTVDSKGFLHIVYFPHHHPFRYRRSERPGDASTWTDPFLIVGSRCTYPTLMCGPDDTLYLTCRESSDKEWTVNLYIKPIDGDWQGPAPILRAMKSGYAHFQEALAWGPDHRTLHLSARFYDGNRGHTIGYLSSEDYGGTWRRSDGQRVDLPATAESVTQIVNARDHEKPGLRSGSIAVDGDGRPHVLFSAAMGGVHGIWLASPDDQGRWQRRQLDELARAFPQWQATMPGGLVSVRRDHFCGAVTLVRAETANAKSVWGHPSSEIAWLESTDGGRSFHVQLISEADINTPHWLPNIERPTGHNRFDRPALIYTAGARGKANTDILANGVVWATCL